MWKKQELLQLANGLFCRYGYRGVSLNDIIKQSRYSKGGFLHYFESKEVLFNEVLSQYLLSLDTHSETQLTKEQLITLKTLVKWRMEFESTGNNIVYQPLKTNLQQIQTVITEISVNDQLRLGLFLLDIDYTKSIEFLKKTSTEKQNYKEPKKIIQNKVQTSVEEPIFVLDE